jgi:hypothetical protein
MLITLLTSVVGCVDRLIIYLRKIILRKAMSLQCG